MVVMHEHINNKSSVSDKREVTLQKVTFAQALRDKYVEQEEVDNRLVLPKDRKISTQITFVGFGTVSSVQKQLKRLTSIDLSSKSIELAGDLNELKGSLDQIQVLNLADNFLSWQEIVSILSCVPRLRELIITNNRLTIDGLPNNFQRFPPSSLKSLTLGRIYSDWNSIVGVLSRIWLDIEQIDLWDNRLSSTSMKLNCTDNAALLIKQIHALRLSHNCFPNLEWVAEIGPIESLTELDLSDCQLQSIDLDEKIVLQLKNLEILNVSNNDLHNWKSISNLHTLRKLKHLICHENPIFMAEKFAKSLTIGRLGQIKFLNREEVTRNERTDSEILYLRKAFPEYQKFREGTNNDFPTLHPRYEELAQFYGLPEDLTRKHVKDKYVTIDLCLGDQKITKKLPCDMRIALVRMLCKRLFKLEPLSRIEITCHEAESSDSDISYALDKDGQTLDFFSVRNGQSLLIKKLDQ